MSQKPAPSGDFAIRTIQVASAPDRLDIALGVAAAAALLAPTVSLFLAASPAWLPGLGSVWRVAHLSGDTGLDSGPFMGALATQAVILIGVTLLWRAVATFAPQSGWFLPGLRVECQARELMAGAPPCVLLYVADAQRSVRVLATPQVAAQLPAGALEAARDALQAGMQAGDAVSAFASARVALRG